MLYAVPRAARRACPCFAVVTCFVAIVVNTAQAQVSGIGYSITPTIEHIRFADDAAIDDSFLWGGRLGFSFGEFIELDGVYLLNRNMKTDFGSFPAPDPATQARFAALPARDLEVARYGGHLKLNLGRGAVFPYVILGAGVMAFEPDQLERSETVYLSSGIGLQYSLRDRYTLVLQGNTLHYRYSPAATLLSADDLVQLGLGADEIGLVDVNSFSGSLGLKLYVGGRNEGQLTDVDRALQRQFGEGWRGLSLRLEPAAGGVNFSGPLGYRNDQRFVGAAAGIDLGAFAGLRGFYWRATEDGSWTNFDKLEAYGGEVQLAFTDAVGLTPFITVGGGFMNVKNGYVGNGQALPEDRPFALAGVGLLLPLGGSVSFVGNVRSMLMSSSGLDAVSDPDQVRSNTMFAAAVSFGLGGGGQGDSPGTVFGREMESARTDRVRLREDLAYAQSRIDSLAAIVAAQDAMLPAQEMAVGAGDSLPKPAGPGASGRRTITVPLPEEGEFYLRFGKPGGVSVETVGGDGLVYYYDPATGAIVAPQASTTAPGTAPTAAAPAATPPAARAAGVTSEQLDAVLRQAMLEERAANTEAGQAAADSVYQRLERLLERRFQEMDGQLDRVRQQSQSPAAVPPVVAAPRTATPGEFEAAPEVSQPGDFEGVRLSGGINFDEPQQGLVGVRAEYRPGARSFLVAPEVVLGFGDGDRTTTVNLNAIRRLPVSSFGLNTPLVGLGFGVQHRNDTKGIFNMLAGIERPVRRGLVSLEYVSQNFFDNNRLLLGYRLGL